MTRSGQKHQLEGLLALLLFGVFAVCLMAVLLTGANTYRALTDRDQAAYDYRVCAQYLAARVRQADRLNGVSVEDFDGRDALVLQEEIDGADYVTYVYVDEGHLKELFCAASNEVSPADGEEIMPAQSLSAELSRGVLKLSLTTQEGREAELLLSLRSEKGAAA